MSGIRTRLSFANVVAVIALFVALGGGAYAAVGGSFVGRTGFIQACVNKGVLDVVKAGKNCPDHTTPLPLSEPQFEQASTPAQTLAANLACHPTNFRVKGLAPGGFVVSITSSFPGVIYVPTGLTGKGEFQVQICNLTGNEVILPSSTTPALVIGN